MKDVTFDNDILGTISVHGIGKFILSSKNDFNIPHLHFITYFSKNEKEYNTLCLELGIHFNDTNHEISIRGMIRGCLEYLNTEITNKKDMDKLVSMVSSTDFEDFWALYRQYEFELAKDKKDLSTKFVEDIKRQAFSEFGEQTFVPGNIEYNTSEKKSA